MASPALPLAGTARKTRRTPRSGKPGANRADGELGPYSRIFRRGGLGLVLSGSSVEGRYVRDIENSLITELGGNPTTAQRMLVARVARIALRIELFERDFAAGKQTTLHDQKIYASLQNSYRLILAEIRKEAWLELARQHAAEPSPPTESDKPPPSLADYLAEKAAKGAAP